MPKIDCRNLIWLLIAILATLLLDRPAAAAQPPNIVFVLVDDMSWADPVCYGNRFYETPNVDALAKQGMRFTDAYAACPVCSPTRASIHSGKYPATLNLTDWLPGMHPTGRKLIGPEFIRQLPLAEITLAESLKTAGYTTGSVGKWHLGGPGFLPEDQGFDVNVAGTAAGSPAGGYYLPNKMNLPGAKPGEYLTDRLSIEACEFIRTNRDRPFFLYLSHHSVHTPIQGKKELTEKYRKKFADAAAKKNAAYAAMMQSADESVGRVLGVLDELKIAERTVVIFMSDNGGLSGVTSNAPLREGKGHVYEGGIREPMIVRWPGVVRPGSVCGVPVVSVDFYPTILEMAGVKVDPQQQLDGESLMPLLRQTGRLNRDAIFWHYPHYSPQHGVPAGAVRVGDYKLMELFEDGHLELYNLADDIGEQNNLADKMPEKTVEMHKLLVDWREKVGARMPTKNPKSP
ncbi:MAG: sulfatase [Candidatus Nealsonbacteria bacterium]|nr:sulfatase [Candidatus Nealsonbacteria bacterium]